MERETFDNVVNHSSSISIPLLTILSKVVYRKNESVEFTGLDIIFLQGCQKVGFGNTAKLEQDLDITTIAFLDLTKEKSPPLILTRAGVQAPRA